MGEKIYCGIIAICLSHIPIYGDIVTALVKRVSFKVFFFKIIIYDHSIYTMAYPDLTVSNFMENSIDLNSLLHNNTF